MQNLFAPSLAPVLVAVCVMAACGVEERRRGGRDGGEGGEPGDGLGGESSGAQPSRAGRTGTAGDSAANGGSVGVAGRTGSETGGTENSGGASVGGDSGEIGGSGAEGGDAGASGAPGAGGSGGTTGGSAGAPPGAGGSTGGSGGSGGSSPNGGTAGNGGSGGSGGTSACSVSIDALNHHLGDGDGSEGTTLSRNFSLNCTCVSPWLSFQLDGAHFENPPRVSLNGTQLPSLQTFFPPITSADVWQTNGDNHDYNGYLQIHYDVMGLVLSGNNTFTITNGIVADDYNFQDVRLECGAPTTPPGPDIVNRGGWVGYYDDRTGDDPHGIQGAFYGYGDGTSCSVPDNVCASGACCMTGTASGTNPETYWGCGLGLQLRSTGGTVPTELAYAGTADCFDVELTGNSGGSDVRMQVATHADMSAHTAPVVSFGPIAGTTRRTVCFSDFACPVDATDCQLTGSFYRLELNLVGGFHAGAFNVCLSSLIPFSE